MGGIEATGWLDDPSSEEGAMIKGRTKRAIAPLSENTEALVADIDKSTGGLNALLNGLEAAPKRRGVDTGFRGMLQKGEDVVNAMLGDKTAPRSSGTASEQPDAAKASSTPTDGPKPAPAASAGQDGNLMRALQNSVRDRGESATARKRIGRKRWQRAQGVISLKGSEPAYCVGEDGRRWLAIPEELASSVSLPQLVLPRADSDAEPARTTGSSSGSARKARKPSPPEKPAADRVLARKKAIAIGKSNPAYLAYIAKIRKELRGPADPMTPDPEADIPNSVYIAQTKQWRRDLHKALE